MISAAHLHLMINHIPLLGAILGATLLIYHFIRPNRQILLCALVVVSISGLAGIPTFFSGEPAEELVEEQAHVSEATIQEHEESAETTVWLLAAMGISGLFALTALSLKKETLANRLNWATLIVSIVAIGLTVRTANLGGKISHPELRSNAVSGEGKFELKNEQVGEGEED